VEGLLELYGEVEQVVYRNENNQYTVLQMLSGDDMVTVVGSFPMVGAGEELRVYGRWESHAAYGPQFRAEAFQRDRPATTGAMLKYLASGAIRGVGPALAARIVEAFGVNALEVIEEDPERLAQVKGITQQKALEISEELRRVNGVRELMAYLGEFGVAPESALLVWKQYGEESIGCVQEEPYLLCAPEIGLSFGIADSVAQSMECPPDDIGRVMAGVLYVLRHNLDNGHTCLPWDKLCPAAAQMLGVELEMAQDAVYMLCESFQTRCEEFDGKDFIFLEKQHLSEEYISARMKAMLRMPPQELGGASAQIAAIEGGKLAPESIE